MEGLAVVGGLALFIGFVLPSLINKHDTMAFFAAMFLTIAGFGWASYFLYRLNGDFK